MESKLLTLWKNVRSESVKQSELTEILQLSTKQTTRYMQRWDDEGWFDFHAGRGRGHTSAIRQQKDVEAIYEDELMRMIERQPIENSAKYLSMDWSTDSRLRLMKVFQTKLGYEQSTNDKLIVPRKYPFMTFHPLEAMEIHSANLVANVYNRLIHLDEEGNVHEELAHSWDVSNERLRLYVKKDIKFHDGSVLTFQDVVNCLLTVKQHSNFSAMWEPITEIRAVDPLVVDLESEDGCSYFLQLLATMNASIYKQVKPRILIKLCSKYEVYFYPKIEDYR